MRGLNFALVTPLQKLRFMRVMVQRVARLCTRNAQAIEGVPTRKVFLIRKFKPWMRGKFWTYKLNLLRRIAGEASSPAQGLRTQRRFLRRQKNHPPHHIFVGNICWN